MTDWTILHPYTPRYREDDQEATWDALNEIDIPRIDIPVRVGKDYEWPGELHKLWGKGDWIICEHDIVPTPEAIDGLRTCEHHACAVAFILQHSPYLGNFCHRVGTAEHFRTVMRNEPFADLVGFGLTKISQKVQEKTPWPGTITTWKTMDTFLSAAVRAKNGRWHIHWPEVHHTHQMAPAKFPLKLLKGTA